MTTPTENPTPTPEPTPAPTPSPPPPAASITLTREELDRQLGDTRKATERELKNSPEYKAALDAAKRLKDIEDANKSEAEKLSAERDKEKTRADGLHSKYRTALIKSDFTAKALAKGIPHDRIDAAFRLADLEAVKVNEDTDAVDGVDAALEALPAWLIQATPSKPPAPDINAGANGQNQPDPVAREADLRRRFRLNS